MASVKERFQAAVNVIKGLPKNGPYQPSTAMMLKFYGLYKQATEGQCRQEKPAFWNVVNKAKWDAWNSNSNLSKEEAMLRYVESLQEIIETMSFTENVQNFVGSLQSLENINLDALGIIAPKMRELAESHPNSPFNSRTNSPQHSNANDNVLEEPILNVHTLSLDDVANSTRTTLNQQYEEHPLPKYNSATSITNLVDYAQTNGSMEQSDDEYADPFDIQSEIYESLQRNTEVLKQVQATVLRMNADMSSVNQRILALEQQIKNLKNASPNQNSSSNILKIKRNYPKWWPFSEISPLWFVVLILWPFIVRRVGKILATPINKRK